MKTNDYSPAAINAGMSYVGLQQLRALFSAIEKMSAEEGDIRQLANLGARFADEYLSVAKEALVSEVIKPAPRPKRQRPKAAVVPIAPGAKD